MTAPERAARTAEADALCARAYADCGGLDVGAALVAVGGYGRSELAPHSDLDVVLVSDEGVDLGELAQKIWYPLWDSGSKIDHSVRTLPEMLAAAEADLRVASGLLDLRHLAGDPNLTLRLRTTMLANWRKGAKERLPALHQMVRSRHDLIGELAHLSVPDLKESEGGLRDATVLRGMVATWLVDVPHADLERCRLALLDVRDVVHGTAGRATERITPEMWPDLAQGLGLPDDRAAQVHVRELGRRLTHLSRLAWRRVDAVLARPVAVGARRPALEPVAAGVALSSGEIVLDKKARPAEDPVLLLRAAVAAAERDAVLAPATAARLVRECSPLPDPWPAEARQLLVRLLASGRSLLGVWETLEETGALSGFLPEWERVRLLPHASVIHRFTVDRHVIETAIEASSLIRGVARPDVLMVSALLHDIGKGGLTEHSVAGEPIARTIATRMGFAPDCVDLIALLVRWHLLLAETATTRDPDDPATVELVTSRLRTVEAVSLLGALTEADAKATSPKAWSSWRSGLILDLARRAHAGLDTGSALPAIQSDDVPIPGDLRAERVHISVEPGDDGSRVTTIAVDRVGLLADFAAMFALQRTPVRAARVWAQGDYGVSVWEVAAEDLEPAILRQKYDAIVDGRLDPSHRLRPAAGAELAPTVVVRPEASDLATVLEVRTADRPGVVYLVCRALARLDVAVRSAHLDTLGPQAVDVFYLQEPSAGVLSETRAAEAAHAVREALTGPAVTA
ncbi:bifunctional uridylyltransferase/uridylyl-removing enzyme [Nocardioides psychrotolerans]|uniref:Bifunctional uridylyltransferase/uridylyl-removing enzyme n=1 Tax=Nocardioides psychrotolerans TaxID=1005945 RepID=A0A1I3CVV4_9ACTN|nr:[protein-PII] uridylyltransferase [Nocardioides psychrotolerans]GEP36919.1 bifunctional uridylyltransferase/uridylyl-removing enzyme [Nocardioides psychrotolerans]SFH78399.1 [protein-PII] uridylyltransferase [Nocardioides psychrotolerans]